MKGIDQYDTATLEAELERRKKLEEDRAMPRPLASPDWQQVIDYCVGEIHDLASQGYADEDSDHYIYEAAMTAVFGKDVWQWINAKLS